MRSEYDAIVVGSGPNGLSAAIVLARAGLSVLVIEAAPTLGGGVRSGELTLPGFTHDICSAVHALARVSPFLKSLPLNEHGLELIDPPAPFAHPFDDGTAAVAQREVEATATSLGEDSPAYRKLFAPLAESWMAMADDLLAPPLHFPRHPLSMARFAINGLRSAQGLCHSHFSSRNARGLFAGVAAHSVVPLDWKATASFGLVLATSAHAAGWPIPQGGSQKLAEALASILLSHGGEFVTGTPVTNLSELPKSRVTLCDLTPRQVMAIAADRLPNGYASRLQRYRYGPGVFKVDYALDGPIPWKAVECATAGTVHLGATLEEITASEADPWQGRCSDRPFVLLVQPTLFDLTRAPTGKHIAWAYCHVPNGSTVDMTERIENQIERFAPGFRDLVLARHVMSPADMERRNANLVGGDISGGASDLRQLFARPMLKANPYTTPVPGLYLCSSSTPPGGGVHGMCGYHAAQAALRYMKVVSESPLQ